MAKTLVPLTSTLFFCFTIFFSLSTTLVIANKPNHFSETLGPNALGLSYKREKLTHLHFYFHEIVSQPNPTSIKVAWAATTFASPTLFGLLAVIDDALTAGPDRASKPVGRAQGLYGLASKSEDMMLMVFTFIFTEGKYNGSSISVLGRNPIFSAVREMPIVGGTGRFRFARGYVEARTHSFEVNTTGNAVVQYDVLVLHY